MFNYSNSSREIGSWEINYLATRYAVNDNIPITYHSFEDLLSTHSNTNNFSLMHLSNKSNAITNSMLILIQYYWFNTTIFN